MPTPTAAPPIGGRSPALARRRATTRAPAVATVAIAAKPRPTPGVWANAWTEPVSPARDTQAPTSITAKGAMASAVAARGDVQRARLPCRAISRAIHGSRAAFSTGSHAQ